MSDTTEYIVQGEKGVDVDIVGTIFKPGDSVDLREDIAKPLLAEGKIVAGPAEENVPVEEDQVDDGSSETPSEGVAEEPRD